MVCLAPTTIGALLSAIGIAGMSRLNQANVLAMSGRAIEAAGDVDILMLDKTGTITLGNRQASEFIPVDGVDIQELADAVAASKARIAELEEQKNAIKVEHSEVSAAEPGMKICPVCGAESDSKFCPKCGAPMD